MNRKNKTFNKKKQPKSKKTKIKTIIRTRPKIRLMRQPTMSAYEKTLMYPEMGAISRVPHNYGDASLLIARHITVAVKTDSSGNLAVVYNPYTLIDNSFTSNNTTGIGNFYITSTNNASITGVYDPSIVTNMRFVSQQVSYGINFNTITQYRLVSCAMTLRPMVNILNLSGTIYGAVTPMTFAAPIAFNTAASVNLPDNITSNSAANQVLLTNITQPRYHCEGSPNFGTYSRLVWTPMDDLDLVFNGIDSNVRSVTPGYSQETGFFFVCTGFTVNGTAAVVNLVADIYANYEVIPAGGSTLAGLESCKPDNTDPSIVLSRIKTKVENLAAPVRGDYTSKF
jgi:hypothetical protein